MPLAGGCHGPRGFLAGPSSLVFVYMLVRQTLRADLVDSLDDLRTTILACLYVTYAYIGCEITYPLKVRSKSRLHATGTARVVCNGRVSVRLSVPSFDRSSSGVASIGLGGALDRSVIC